MTLGRKALAGLFTTACTAWALAQPPVQTLDYIVAVVNAEPITYQQLQREVVRVRQQLEQQNKAVPKPELLHKQVLEQMVDVRAQIQSASELGIRVEEATLDRLEQNAATQNDTTVDGLHQLLQRDGISVADFRRGLRDQVALDRVRERVVDSAARVSDVEVDVAIQQRIARQSDPYVQEVNLAQILVAVPEKASESQVAALYRKAQNARARLLQGQAFDAVLQTESDSDKRNGGQLGLRRADRYPEIFIETTKNVPVGAVSEVVRSNAGFHILLVQERRPPETLVLFVTQTNARHILLRLDSKLTQADAVAQLAKWRSQIVAGKVDFAAVARSLSQDGSAAGGGDLGWMLPGMLVPEFETPMNALPLGAVSKPVVSRFGVHLIQVLDRRKVELSPAQVREAVGAELRRARQDEAYRNWADDVRARAFVEYKEMGGPR